MHQPVGLAPLSRFDPVLEEACVFEALADGALEPTYRVRVDEVRALPRSERGKALRALHADTFRELGFAGLVEGIVAELASEGSLPGIVEIGFRRAPSEADEAVVDIGPATRGSTLDGEWRGVLVVRLRPRRFADAEGLRAYLRRVLATWASRRRGRVAWINPLACLAIGHGSCHVCLEACPVPEAVRFDESGVPHVDPDLCNGCGLCILACTVANDLSGIELLARSATAPDRPAPEPPAAAHPATAPLRSEHSELLAGLAELEEAGASLSSVEPMTDAARTTIERAVHRFAEDLALHIRKEEDGLFQALTACPVSGHRAQLSAEHDALLRIGRLALPAAAEAVLRCDPPEEARIRELTALIGDLGLLLRHHIGKEEACVFWYADGNLSEAEARAAAARMEDIERAARSGT